jgi:magnesium-transporting ATPase (P-type)
MGKMAVKKKKIDNSIISNSQFMSGLAISSMVFGIIALLFFWVVFVGAIMGVLAFALGVASMRIGKYKNISFVGIVTGLVAVIMNLAMVFFFISGLMTYSIVTNPVPVVSAQGQ